VRKYLLLSLIVIASGVFVAFQLARDPGYILIAFAGWTFETSVFAMLVALLFLFVLFRLVLNILRWLNPMRFFKESDKRSP